MTAKRRYIRDPIGKAAETISFRVPTMVKATIESSTANEPSEFWRSVAEKIATAIERGATVDNIMDCLENVVKT